MLVTRLGHAALLVETGTERLLFDPGSFSDAWHGLTGLEAVLITHQHLDHVDVADLPGLVAANPSARLLVEPSLVAPLAEQGVEAEAAPAGTSYSFAGAAVEVVGGRHAQMHPSVPRVGNVGFVVAEVGGARLFHPGDSYETVPPGVDILALPLQAPWAALADTVAFLDAVAPAQALPVHDALLSDQGRQLYLRALTGIAAHGGSLRPVDPIGSLSV